MALRKVWKVEPVVLADAPALARNNMSAFWEDRPWRLSWEGTITLDYLIMQTTSRFPNDLLHRRDVLRHLKAVDPDTGELMGYLRAALPVEHATTPDGAPVWSDIQTADVSPMERERIHKVSENASLKLNDNGAEEVAFAIQERILSQGIYISK
jgi:hypothetical protein